MNTRALLDGHEFDLAALARRFSEGDPRIIVADGGTFLEASALGSADFTDGGQLVEIASGILARLNGWATLDDPSYRPVKLGYRFHRDHPQGGGSDAHLMAGDQARLRDDLTVVVVGTAEARMSAFPVMTVGGATSSQPATPDGYRQLKRATDHPDVDDLLLLLGRAEHIGWDQLWKAMEIIKVACGGKAALLATGWVTSDDLDEFGYAANHPDASGTDARHARRPPATPPGRVMSLAEGQQFVRDLSRRWVDSLP
ncbi:hypothetical protein [Actinokineospora cianjurensis]|uniref:Uncharacterized protein n=1 Tax=Actinokineospora cianjurensis TaxID=585224 RepID=A0A421BC32_9PSEU|nr:hypothetical protein [Actinokineospora cianjurensis]RLK61896.1 hypothetical protein CLV68_2441 [Actinokineospora cianjurensis]